VVDPDRDKVRDAVGETVCDSVSVRDEVGDAVGVGL